jgi:hypothetical protein
MAKRQNAADISCWYGNAAFFFTKKSSSHSGVACGDQGGQIGRNFAYWAIFLLLGSFFKLSKVAQILGIPFSTVMSDVILTKKDWAALWAIFLQTHLVTLDSDVSGGDESDGSKQPFIQTLSFFALFWFSFL